MGSIKSIPMTIDQCCESLEGTFEGELTREILTLFVERGYTYLVSATNPDRIYCYIKKSKESVIINKTTYLDRDPSGGYAIQVRIQSGKTFEGLGALSDNVRGCILGGRNCKAPHCCNCGKAYAFDYDGKRYIKCHMLCDNFSFSRLTPEDRESMMTIIRNEMK